eukprot:NODE_22380_length_711_cov_1.782534.p2 GENE.NODE_22380_length_711_cov_1.782534~~NODE_22380_length_711_cov_1.782534.p2  ORF type:complete len:88 (-),score=18.73 NODE_22380_length_711_cov_1.782534:203-466(-)
MERSSSAGLRGGSSASEVPGHDAPTAGPASVPRETSIGASTLPLGPTTASTAPVHGYSAMLNRVKTPGEMMRDYRAKRAREARESSG